MKNIEHRTLNIERRIRETRHHSMFGVRRSMFDVFFPFAV